MLSLPTVIELVDEVIACLEDVDRAGSPFDEATLPPDVGASPFDERTEIDADDQTEVMPHAARA